MTVTSTQFPIRTKKRTLKSKRRKNRGRAEKRALNFVEKRRGSDDQS